MTNKAIANRFTPACFETRVAPQSVVFLVDKAGAIRLTTNRTYEIAHQPVLLGLSRRSCTLISKALCRAHLCRWVLTSFVMGRRSAWRTHRHDTMLTWWPPLVRLLQVFQGDRHATSSRSMLNILGGMNRERVNQPQIYT